MKPNYIVIPLITLIAAYVGSMLTSAGMGWYRTINLPSWTPAGGFIGGVWTTIFILSTISALIIWNRFSGNPQLKFIGTAFIINAIINVGWSYLFFYSHNIGGGVIGAFVLGLSVLALIFYIWPLSRLASILLWPYAGWVFFATYLNYVIWTLNR